MPVGLVILLAVSALVYFGVFQRVLDRMGLTDTIALVFIAAILIGSYLPEIPLGDNFGINIGGALIPLILAIYLISRAGTWKERWRAIIASLITAVIMVGVMRIIPLEPTYGGFIDPTILLGLIAGIIGYLAGRSRRSAFVAGIMGIVLSDIYTRLEVFVQGVRGTTIIGGAGIFDAVVLSGIVAVLLAETLGELIERVQGGSKKDRPVNLKKNLTQPELSTELYLSENYKSKLKNLADKNQADDNRQKDLKNEVDNEEGNS